LRALLTVRLAADHRHVDVARHGASDGPEQGDEECEEF
jgi:hypothetical protein